MDYLEHNGWTNFELCIVMVILATTTVAIRLVVKVQLMQRVSVADYTCLAALLVFWGHSANIIYCKFIKPKKRIRRGCGHLMCHRYHEYTESYQLLD